MSARSRIRSRSTRSAAAKGSGALHELAQPRVLSSVPQLACATAFRLEPGAAAKAALRRLRDALEPGWGVLGIGEPLACALGRTLPGLRTFPALSGAGASVPSIQHALWISLHAEDRTSLFDRMRAVTLALAPAFDASDTIDLFMYRGGHDLTGYEDGTENPKDEAAIQAALITADVPGLRGGSFVAVQRWQHDTERFAGLPGKRRDAIIGRSAKDNHELAGAPASAHVKRSAQESFDPPAFMVRRSMPWASGNAHGLEFVAYGESLDRFERVLRRMLGLDDGVVDALFEFSRPITGAYYFCPPVRNGKLDLRALGL